MNINFYYKGQTVSLKADLKFDLKRIYESAISKFEPHFYQELLLFGINLRLRSRQTNSLLDFRDIVGDSLQYNDTINIEPKENLTTSSPNAHAPKRYDLATIDCNYSPVAFHQSEISQMKNNVNSKMKSSSKYPYSTNTKNGDNGYRFQKSVQSHGSAKAATHQSRSPFDRNDLRRSLGANLAPQYDTQAYGRIRGDNTTTNYDSDSSVSDFTNMANQRLIHYQNHQSQSEDHKSAMPMSKSAPASPTKPIPPIRSPNTHMSKLNAFNVRTIGNKINISIVKRPDFGFGFTIVTRDNQVLYGSSTDLANSVVILVNKILPNGGAALDNRLRPGDRLLEMNGVPFISQKDVMDKLRAIPENQSVDLLISRVDNYEMQSNEESLLNTNNVEQSRRQITIDIPLNQNSKSRQQLGLNILCLTESDAPSMGPGIYIHSIVVNSLASQQGELCPGDKIIGINSRSLNNVNVEETISQLKRAMQHDSLLSITVCRTVTIDSSSAALSSKDTPKREKNFYLLPNKLSMDKRATNTHRYDNRYNVCSSYYSSSESLPYQPTDPGPVFVRESNGRRSMSDKRKAHEDASKYAFYQQTRIGDDSNSAEDRLYSTLPTASRLKKMSKNQTPCLPNKTQAPLKPSQIKHNNGTKAPQEHLVRGPKVPSRSISLRTSPTRLNQRVPDPCQSPKCVSQTPTVELQTPFNRAMNNSFKRAVQKSLPDSEQCSTIVNSFEQPYLVRNEFINAQQQIQMFSGHQNKDNIPRSSSVKTPEEKKRNFNLKTFLTFTPNLSRPKNILPKEKSNTLPLNVPPQYNSPSFNSATKQPHYAPIVQLTQEVQPYDDPIIIDSTKRVLEWQMKNDDVISKENLMKEHNTYHTNSPFGSTNYKNKNDVKISNRTANLNKNNSTIATTHDSDPYDIIDAPKASVAIPIKQKHSHSKAARSNSHSINDPPAPSNGISGHINKITYQVTNPRNNSNDVYATVDKGTKKETKPFGASLRNEYRF